MTPNKPYIIGLTGGIATGKSHLSRSLREAGAVVIDADQIAHGLTAPGGAALPALRARFGDGVFEGDTLRRAALADIVFSDPKALQDLNAITHPLIFAKIKEQISNNRHQPALVIDLPLLFETGFESSCDEVWCALADHNTQLVRLMGRGMGLDQAEARINSQMPAEEKAARAHQVITTLGRKEDSKRQVVTLWNELIARLQHG